MVDKKISDYAALAGASLAVGDLFEAVDVSDTSMAASGTNKEMTAEGLAVGLANLGALGVTRHIVKTADETVTGSTALQNDDELLFPVSNSATEIWWFEALLRIIGANVTMDMKVALTGPAGATASWGFLDHANTALPGFAPFGTTTAPFALFSIASVQAIGTSANNFLALHAAGWVFGGGTAGDLALQWAQNTSDAGNLTVKKGSFLRVTKLVA